MLFNSLDFAIFLPLVFLLYWPILLKLFPKKYTQAQNLFILIASYIFYGWWDWRFLSLIFISPLVDYIVGLKLSRTKKKQTRKLWLFLSVGTNLGLLGFFKYYGFFIDSFAELLLQLGLKANPSSLNIILPVGISFYTFQTLSYTIDIYKKELKPTKEFIEFFAFVSFFPQLVAGPIERAKNLLPQFHKSRKFSYKESRDGARQIVWGLFKKVVVADNCAWAVDHIFSNYHSFTGFALLMAAVFFAFQIYGDFSGYSDIAIGTARLFGFKLMRNFALPYFSRDIAEFWRRWHISLSSWFRDYVYIPLGGSMVSKFHHIRNILITFTLSGLWHGANWTFIFWGFLNGLYYIPLLLSNSHKKFVKKKMTNNKYPPLTQVFQMVLTFSLTTFAWIFFRSESIGNSFEYISIIFSKSLFIPKTNGYFLPIKWVILLVVIEWTQRAKSHPLQIDHLNRFIRWIIYLSTIFLILEFGRSGENEFIYFQF